MMNALGGVYLAKYLAMIYHLLLHWMGYGLAVHVLSSCFNICKNFKGILLLSIFSRI